MKNERILPCVEEKIMNIDTKKMLLEEEKITAEQFEERNLLNIISVGIFLIAGPLFILFWFLSPDIPFHREMGLLIGSDRFSYPGFRLQSLAGSPNPDYEETSARGKCRDYKIAETNP